MILYPFSRPLEAATKNNRVNNKGINCKGEVYLKYYLQRLDIATLENKAVLKHVKALDTFMFISQSLTHSNYK
jgi:hypothetical protein